ncbi:hypothetical protein V1477_007077 [Vespula maculifrons]|uniref:Uncharacterized protein n=1 Tax=Vespula maculifrons TaxID=7453 RepID=A0ABD2CIB6_VESMC
MLIANSQRNISQINIANDILKCIIQQYMIIKLCIHIFAYIKVGGSCTNKTSKKKYGFSVKFARHFCPVLNLGIQLDLEYIKITRVTVFLQRLVLYQMFFHHRCFPLWYQDPTYSRRFQNHKTIFMLSLYCRFGIDECFYHTLYHIQWRIRSTSKFLIFSCTVQLFLLSKFRLDVLLLFEVGVFDCSGVFTAGVNIVVDVSFADTVSISSFKSCVVDIFYYLR